MFRILHLALFSLCWWLLSPALIAQSTPPPPPRPTAPTQGADGRIEIPGTGFSMLPPPGWEILHNSHGSTLLFRGPKTTGTISYQPTIQVMVFQGSRYIDDMTQQEYGNIIVEKFSSTSNQLQDYRLRSAEKVKLETGDDSILYYTEFNYGSVPIMQMHILVSSATHHFLMTYTDLAHIFESENSQGLLTAYSSMHSAVLASRPPSRFNTIFIGGGAFVLLLVFWFTFRFIRSYQMSRLGERMEAEESLETRADQENEYYSRQSLISKTSPKGKSKVKRDAYEDQDEDHDSDEDIQVHENSDEGEAEKGEEDWTGGRKKAAVAQQSPALDLHLTPPPAPLRASGPQRTSPPVMTPELQPIQTAPVAKAPVIGAVPPELPTAPTAVQPPMPPPLAELPPRITVPPTPASAVPPPSAPIAVPRPAIDLDEDLGTQHSEVAKLSDILPQDGSEDVKKSKKKRGFLWGRKESKDQDADDEEAIPMSDAWAVDESTDKLAEESDIVAFAANDEVVKAKEEAESEDDEAEVTAPKSKDKAKLKGKAPRIDKVAKSKDDAKTKAKGKAKAEEEEDDEDDAEGDSWNLSAADGRSKGPEDEEDVG